MVQYIDDSIVDSPPRMLLNVQQGNTATASIQNFGWRRVEECYECMEEVELSVECFCLSSVDVIDRARRIECAAA